jgi:hypothetical protein
MRGPGDFAITPEQKEKIKAMIAQIERMAESGHFLPFVCRIGDDRRVFEEVAKEARKAGWDASFVDNQLTIRGSRS